MANIKSAKKRVLQTTKRQAKNRGVRSRLRTSLKEHRATAHAETAAKMPATYSEIDKALKKGVIHRNAAARYKSRLAKKAAAPVNPPAEKAAPAKKADKAEKAGKKSAKTKA